MRDAVVVIGGGMGGLAAATRLARRGLRVVVLEARDESGGLAGGFSVDGLDFDAGPYVLLDRPGLEWAFETLGLRLSDHLRLRRLDVVYEVGGERSEPVQVRDSAVATAEGFERRWHGSARAYLDFVDKTRAVYTRLEPLLRRPRPRMWDVVRAGAWRDVPFLLRSFASVMEASALPDEVVSALSIWTHVAGQSSDDAPSPMACVPALVHTAGAHVPEGGMAAVPRALAAAAVAAGASLRFGVRVKSIRLAGGHVTGVETTDGETISADAVVSNAGGVGTYLDLVQPEPPGTRDRLARWPLQSPGCCAYLAVRTQTPGPYLRFREPARGRPCALLVLPGAVAPESARGGWWPARLLAPMDHGHAEEVGETGQRDHLQRLLDEPWWREHVSEARVLAMRVPAQWGAQYHLYRNSMNPVMTGRLMRGGRLAHRSPNVRGLYLAGASTHPGQWVSFCAISGILAADCLLEDLS